MQEDHLSQTTAQKVSTLAAGVGGMSLKLADISAVAQQIGMIVGCVLVCGQAVLFFRGIFVRWKRGSAANDR